MPQFSERFAILAAALASDPRAATTLARQLGFVGLLFDAFGSSLNLTELSASGRREFRRMLTSQDRQLVGLRVDAGPKGLGPGADVDRIVNQLDRVMETAVGLGTPLVCVEIGPLPEPAQPAILKPAVTQQAAGLIILPTFAPEPPPQAAPSLPPPDPAFIAQVDGALLEIGRRADRYSAVLAFRSELSSLAALEQILTRAGCPWFGVDLDPVAILRDPWPLDETFSRMGALLRHVRAHDAARGADRRTKPTALGRGNVEWPQLLSNLDDAGYQGWITLDPTELPDRQAGAAAGLQHLKEAAAARA